MEDLAEKASSRGAITLRNFSIGQQLIEQDQHSRSVYIIKSGIVKCFITEDNGKDYILEFLGEGEMLGEIEAIRQLPTLCTIEAITPVTTYTISHVQFSHFLQTIPDFSSILIDLLATRVAHSSTKAARQQLYTLAEILPRLLSTLNSQQITFTKQDLSEYLGISVRSLNRLLKDAPLSDAGDTD
jgi:CRP-like cAMP-binding protein